jgi:hypothetical protein
MELLFVLYNWTIFVLYEQPVFKLAFNTGIDLCKLYRTYCSYFLNLKILRQIFKMTGFCFDWEKSQKKFVRTDF